MHRLVLSVLLLFCLAPAVLATYPAGYVHQGYTYQPLHHGQHNLWWKGYQGYTRTFYQPPSYYAHGSYGYHLVQPTGYYQYSLVYTYTPPAQTPVTPPADWRSELLRRAAALDKAENDVRKMMLEQQQYLEAVKVLGLDGQGRPLPYAGYQHYRSYNVPYAAQGQTVYGTSYNSITQLYGDTSLSMLYQSAARHTDNAQKLSGQAQQDFASLVAQEGGNRARVAEILAKGQAAQQAFRALESQGGTVTTQQWQFKVEPGKPLTPQMPRVDEQSGLPPQAQPNGKALLLAHLQKDCAACHTNPQRGDAFRVSDWDAYPPAAKKAAHDRVVSKDEDQRMPRLPGGGAGPRVPPEIAELYLRY